MSLVYKRELAYNDPVAEGPDVEIFEKGRFLYTTQRTMPLSQAGTAGCASFVKLVSYAKQTAYHRKSECFQIMFWNRF